MNGPFDQTRQRLWGAEGCVMPNYRWLCACKHKAIWQYVWVCVWVDFCLCMYTVLLSCHDVCSAWLHSSVRELSLSLYIYIYICKDTLRVRLVYGLVRLVDVLHGDGVRELVEHSLLESLQPLVVMAAAHKLLILQRNGGRADSVGLAWHLVAAPCDCSLGCKLHQGQGPVTSFNGIE